MPKVKAVVKQYGGDEDDSYDVFQESILKLYDHIKTGKFNTKYSINGFVITISRNAFIDIIRKRNKHTEIQDFHVEDDEFSSSDYLNNLITKEKEQLINKVLNKIGERCKKILIFSIFYDMSSKDLCKKMGFSSENGAKTRKYKCKQKLIKYFKEHPEVLKEIDN